jgi:ribonuclease P protein component
MLRYSPPHEAHLPAAQHSQGAHSRLPRPHVDTGWPQSASEPPPQGSQAFGADHLQEVGALPLGFAQERRLRKHAEFVQAQRSGRRVTTAHFTMLVARQPESPRSIPRPPRLGMVVARSVGSAVLRNRVKRLCRECFRAWPSFLPDGIDLIVIARPGAHELGLAEVHAEWRDVERLLNKRAAEALARGARTQHPGEACNSESRSLRTSRR